MGKTFIKLINKQLEMLFIGESSERDPFRCHLRTDGWLGVGAGGVSGDFRWGGPYVVMLQIKTMRVSVAPRRQMDTEIHGNSGTLARRHPGLSVERRHNMAKICSQRCHHNSETHIRFIGSNGRTE